MKFHNRILAWIGSLILGAMLVVHAYAQSQISAESAFLKSLPMAARDVLIEVHGLHTAPSPIGNLLFFSLKDAKSGSLEYRYAPVKRNILGNWQVGYSGKCSQDGEMQTGMEFASFHAHSLWLPYDYNSMTEVSIVCGHIHKQAIQTVVVIWQDGTSTQDEVKESRFVLFAQGRIAACQLQLFDQSSTLVKEIDLSQIEFVSTDATTSLPHCTKQPHITS